MIPLQFHAYLDVFEKAPSERMPVRKPWDHAIDLNPNFVPWKSKLYPMSPMKQQEVRDFVDNQLKKGYINQQNHHRHPWCFLSPRRMERNKWYKIISTWTKERSRTIIHDHSLQNSLIALAMQKYLQS